MDTPDDDDVRFTADDDVLEQLQEETRQLKEIQRKQCEKLDDLVRFANRITQAVACAESRQDAWTGDFLDVERHRQAAEVLTPRL